MATWGDVERLALPPVLRKDAGTIVEVVGVDGLAELIEESWLLVHVSLMWVSYIAAHTGEKGTAGATAPTNWMQVAHTRRGPAAP